MCIGVDEAKTFANFTLCQTFRDIFGDVDELAALEHQTKAPSDMISRLLRIDTQLRS